MKQIEAEDKIKAVEDRAEAIIAQKELKKEQYAQENLEKEQAAEDRRQMKEKERLDWLRKLSEKRQIQESRICNDKQIQSNLQKQLAKEREETRLARKREIELKDEAKNQKLREKIQSKKEQYERNQTEILNAKREKAADLSSGNLYSSLDADPSGSSPTEKIKIAKTDRSLTRSLPNSPRVGDCSSTSVKSSSSSHIRNLFKKSTSSEVERNGRRKS